MYMDVNTHIINLGYNIVDFLNKREENKLLENCTYM